MMKQIGFDEWVEEYQPEMEDPDTPELFEPELAGSFFGNLPMNRVWTLVETDGVRCIVPGFHMVNRVGYYMTDISWTSDEIEVTNVPV